MSPDRLDRRRLNRATLARQLLLERVEMPGLQAVEHLVGLQAQAPLAPYVALWSRLQAWEPGSLASALESGAAVRTHAMRATVHLFSRDDALTVRALTDEMLGKRFGSTAFAAQLREVELDLERVCRVGEQLTTASALTRVELAKELGTRFPGADPTALAYLVTYRVPMVQTPPRAVWGKRGAARWQTYRGWLGCDLGEAPPPDDVVRRYLRAFGPAGVADARTWSGLSALGEVFERLRPDLRTFTDENGRELFDLDDAPRPDPATPTPVRFLPEYDNLLLSHADRSRVIPDGRRVPLPPGDGARAGTVLVDGDFRATWAVSLRGTTATLRVNAMPPLSSGEADDVRREGERLLVFVLPILAKGTTTLQVEVTGG